MPKPWILVLADDLTGALEAGAQFAGRGLTVEVTTRLSMTGRPESDVLVIDTETRHCVDSEAFELVYRTTSEAAQFAPWLVYKKTDSTLRGNIAWEFRALQNVFPERSLIYAPAYPEMGRTVKDGRLYVWGKLLHETEFAEDSLNPVRASDVKAMLGDERVLVLDGESSMDMSGAARLINATDPPALAAGPSALAAALADELAPGLAFREKWPSVSRCLVVNGSLHPVSLAQLSEGHAQGCFQRGWTYFEDYPEASGLDRAFRTGERVCQLLEESTFDALIVFGGDTAFGIHSALGAPVFEPCGEVLPGVPLSRCGGLFWITKAGGFGTPGVLSHIQKLLR